jgi:hypothetical protein
MPAELLDTLIDTLQLSTLFVITTFLPLIVQLALFLFAGWALDRLALLVSRRIATLLNLIGTPVHEFSHALARTVTLCGVDAITPLIDPATGEASTYSKRTHFLGDILSSLAPLFGGMMVLWLTARYIIPGFEVPTVALPQLNLESSISLGTVLQETMGYLERFLPTLYPNLINLRWSNWRTYVGLYIAVSVAAGIAPSAQDLKNLARGLPIGVALFLALFAWLQASGDAEARLLAVQASLGPHLIHFSTIITYAFVLASLGVFLFLPIGLWNWWRRQ